MKRPRSVSGSTLICIAALAVMAVNCVLAIEKTSITADEIIHIPAGYYSLTAGEFRMNAEHPPVAKMVAALPLLFFLRHETGPAQAPGNFSERGAHFYNYFWGFHPKAFRSIWFWSRTAMLTFTVGLGVLLFVTTRRWFGSMAAVFAILFFTLEPTILGHAKIVHTDIASAFVYLLFFVVLYAYAGRPSLRNAIFVGLTTGLALATKFSMVVLLPVLAAYLAFQIVPRTGNSRSMAERLGHPLLITILILFSINAAYRFRNPPLGPDEAWIRIGNRQPILAIRTIETLSHVLPRDFLFGIYIVGTHNSGGDSSSILGKYDYKGWWYYFPVAFALKTPLPFLLLSIAGLLWALWRLGQKEWGLLRVLLPLAIYAALVMTSRINIGVRHFLPAFPFFIMLAGVLLSRLYQRIPKTALAIAIAALGLMGIDAARTFPYYLSYMNQFKRSNPGWQYLSDSNVEWGDAVPELVQFLKSKGASRLSGALLGGRLTLHFYGIEFVDLFAPPPRPETKYVALGASFLNGSTVPYGDSTNGRGTEQERVHFFDAYRNLTPVAIFGNSIYLYETTVEGSQK